MAKLCKCLDLDSNYQVFIINSKCLVVNVKGIGFERTMACNADTTLSTDSMGEVEGGGGI